ncbi:nuclear factor erythroid 2-related factor 3 [Denticeps clupeoides]|uniref:nuclear factor erythroid 2-related factor 3 n=1 Tax=Denticeps clupeoides TaxID=299321 RepID=UPI0010A4CF70|nr:transcription factor NF-E2 45 kDa subunit-like [Denticeps clupeoides]
MQQVKKYLTEGLIQAAILLSLLGPPPVPGPHAKCPELHRQLALRDVRALAAPARRRFPTRLDAWLVHLVRGDEAREPPQDAPVEAGGHVTAASDEDLSVVKQEEDEEEISAAPLHQETHTSAVGHESLFSSGTDLQQRWQDFLSLPEFDDLERLADLGVADLSAAISHNVSLQEAMVTRARWSSGQPGPSLLRLESSNSSLPDAPSGDGGELPPPPFPLVNNASGNGGAPAGGGGYLDEAVFEQIGLLGLEGLDVIGCELLGEVGLAAGSALLLDDPDSDSGLSVESSRSSASPCISSSSGSLLEYEGGATGYSSEVESLPPKGVAYAERVYHDHAYCAQPLPASIKQEVESEEEEEEELSRDGQRVRALGLPYSALQIVNMPMEHFLELLEGRGLSGPEAGLLRDVRRRGKNKLAAQNCRKRKLEAIAGLQLEVEGLAARREHLLRERNHVGRALALAKRQVQALSHEVLLGLRDERGRPLTPNRHALHCTADGRVVVRRRGGSDAGKNNNKRKKEKKP